MKVKELIGLLSEYNPEEEIFIWRGNGHIQFDYTSNIKISRPYGNCTTNKGSVNIPLIISNNYEKDKRDEKIFKR